MLFLNLFIRNIRRREIGIRKVLGASVAGVMQLLTREFLMPVLISIAIATPITWWIMHRWLSGMAYRIDLSFCTSHHLTCFTVSLKNNRYERIYQ